MSDEQIIERAYRWATATLNGCEPAQTEDRVNRAWLDGFMTGRLPAATAAEIRMRAHEDFPSILTGKRYTAPYPSPYTRLDMLSDLRSAEQVDWFEEETPR